MSARLSTGSRSVAVWAGSLSCDSSQPRHPRLRGRRAGLPGWATGAGPPVLGHRLPGHRLRGPARGRTVRYRTARGRTAFAGPTTAYQDRHRGGRGHRSPPADHQRHHARADQGSGDVSQRDRDEVGGDELGEAEGQPAASAGHHCSRTPRRPSTMATTRSGIADREDRHLPAGHRAEVVRRAGPVTLARVVIGRPERPEGGRHCVGHQRGAGCQHRTESHREQHDAGDRDRRALPGQRFEQRAETERDDDRLDPPVIAHPDERAPQHVEVTGARPSSM